jgi:quinohemoprotein ethanol dehydrogenase
MLGARGGGGTATTGGGLVLQGRGTGEFTVLDAKDGKLLWSFAAQTAVMAQPITYRAGGRQYIAVVAGSRLPSAQGLPQGEWDYRSQQWRVLAFALDGKDRLPPARAPDRTIPDDPAFRVDPARARAGAATYADYCGGCHGANALSGGSAPDLLRSSLPLDLATFRQVVKEGPLVTRGMPAFGEVPDAAVDGIAHFLRQRAREVARTQPASKIANIR